MRRFRMFGRDNLPDERPGGGRKGGTKPGAGPAGNCVCPKCGHKVPHNTAKPCYEISCPQCGEKMVRE